ncbi:MAG: putative Ig domain-containing protein [Planctomycetaceae bacterium]|nr:putative Ig domain-containing protein [Planctomycetaceae bacterium]
MLSRYRGALAIALLLALAAATPVHAQPVGEKLVIDTPDPQFELSATVGIAWLEQFDVRGGGPDPARRDDLSWEAKDIPPWLSLSPRFGVLTGTPTQAGRFTFKIAAEDLSPGTGWIKSDETEYTLVVNGASAPQPLTLSTTVLEDAIELEPYCFQLVASGGTPPYDFSLSYFDPPEPTGLSIGADGRISGTPAAGTMTFFGPYVITVQIMDNSGAGLVTSIDLWIEPAGSGSGSHCAGGGGGSGGGGSGGGGSPTGISIATASLLPAYSGELYSQPLEVLGGTAPFDWSVSGAPGGINVRYDPFASAWLLKGTANTSRDRNYDITLTVTDAEGSSASARLTLELFASESAAIGSSGSGSESGWTGGLVDGAPGGGCSITMNSPLSNRRLQWIGIMFIAFVAMMTARIHKKETT